MNYEKVTSHPTPSSCKNWAKTAAHPLLRILIATLCLGGILSFHAYAQPLSPEENAQDHGTSQTTQVAQQIKVRSTTSDQAIDLRLTDILQATGWFSEVTVDVDKGIVFLDGRTETEEYRRWAEETASKILDVAAVVNRIQVSQRSPWDLSPVIGEIQKMWNTVLRNIPRFVMAIGVLCIFWAVSKMIAQSLRTLFDHRLNQLLRDLTIRIVTILTFLFACYLALQVAGLSGLAATVLGGTGLAGLVAGIAFRDILENYLASILISLRNPFRIGDLVEIQQYTGIVEKVTTRGTVLMNLDGNHVQIPNAIVYKSIIRNYTANPNRREMFEIGIGFENEASHAQEIALGILNEHPAVLPEPEPLVLVDKLGSATVILKTYFWYDGSRYNGLKVKSSLIRLVKRTFESKNISMPDEAREILFPQGVPVQIQEKPSPESVSTKQKTVTADHSEKDEELATTAEGDLASEDGQLRHQARSSRVPEEGASLIQEQK